MWELDNQRSKAKLGLQYTALPVYARNIVDYYATHPRPEPESYRRRSDKPREVADPANLSDGCAFHSCCIYAQEQCNVERPEWQEVMPEHVVACHVADTLELQRVEK